jgi:hypothetical protein
MNPFRRFIRSDVYRNIVSWIEYCFDDGAVPGSSAQLISITPQKATPAEAENVNRFRRLLRNERFHKWMWRTGTVVTIWQIYDMLFKN